MNSSVKALILAGIVKTYMVSAYWIASKQTTIRTQVKSLE